MPTEAHIWHLNTIQQSERLVALRDCLSTDEQAAADRMLREEDRVRYLVSHVALRMILACYVDCLPQNCEFIKGEHGKPFLVGSDLQFNMSHAHEQVLVMVSRHPVGVDIEWDSRELDVLALAERFFCPSEFQLIRDKPTAAQQRQCFLRIWVLKEAYIKYTGRGLTCSLQSFAIDPRLSVNILPECDLTLVEHLPHYCAAYASGRQVENVKYLDFIQYFS